MGEHPQAIEHEKQHDTVDQPRHSLYWSVLAAGFLFLLDVVLFIPGIGMLLSLLRALIAAAGAFAKLLFRPATAKRPAQVMLIYLTALAAIVLGMRVQEQVGLRNAEPVIAALRKHKHETGEYPAGLEELVPRYIDALPLSSYRITSNSYHFQHDENGTYLFYYPAPPTIYNEYNFDTSQWDIHAAD